MKKIAMVVGGLGVIGTILFILKNNYEGIKEIERLDEERMVWKDAFEKANEKTCALEVEKAGVQNVLRRMGEELNKAMIKSDLPFWDAKTLDDYISD